MVSIQKHRPILFVENDRREKSKALISSIQANGYDLWWYFSPLFSPNNFNGQTENIFENLTSINMIALPKERHAQFDGFHQIQSPEEWWQNLPDH